MRGCIILKECRGIEVINDGASWTVERLVKWPVRRRRGIKVHKVIHSRYTQSIHSL